MEFYAITLLCRVNGTLFKSRSSSYLGVQGHAWRGSLIPLSFLSEDTNKKESTGLLLKIMSSLPMRSETSLRPETAVALSPRETSSVGEAATDRLTIQNASRGHSRKKKKTCACVHEMDSVGPGPCSFCVCFAITLSWGIHLQQGTGALLGKLDVHPVSFPCCWITGRLFSLTFFLA